MPMSSSLINKSHLDTSISIASVNILSGAIDPTDSTETTI